MSEKKESDKKESSKISKIKDATDHIIEDKGKITIDTLDPETEEKKFKEGDKIKFGDKTGVVGKEIEDNIHEVILDKKKENDKEFKGGDKVSWTAHGEKVIGIVQSSYGTFVIIKTSEGNSVTINKKDLM